MLSSLQNIMVLSSKVEPTVRAWICSSSSLKAFVWASRSCNRLMFNRTVTLSLLKIYRLELIERKNPSTRGRGSYAKSRLTCRVSRTQSVFSRFEDPAYSTVTLINRSVSQIQIGFTKMGRKLWDLRRLMSTLKKGFWLNNLKGLKVKQAKQMY